MAPAKKKDRGPVSKAGQAQVNEFVEDVVGGVATLVPDSDTEFLATNILPPDIIRSEVNFLVLPFLMETKTSARRTMRCLSPGSTSRSAN